MTKVTSDAQRLANAANTQHSTGPKTAEGKAASAANAIKHGLLSRAVVLEGPRSPESRAEFDQLLTQLTEELSPRNLLEQALVDRIAACYWRMRRARTSKTVHFAWTSNPTTPPTSTCANSAKPLPRAKPDSPATAASSTC